jgi:acetyltransferase-like isoleucine patch superfamily enzyme
MPLNNTVYFLHIISLKIDKYIGYLNILRAQWWGIKLGSHPVFYGKSHFFRYPGTEISIGDNCRFRSTNNSNLIGINRPCTISTQNSNSLAKIEIGNNCGFSGTVIGSFKSIKIGNNVNCGANTLITDSDWHLDDYRSGQPQDVIIENNVWLGVNSIVLKGVTIGENSVIGANSVVTKSIPANVVAAGNPCKVIKNIL